MGEIRHTDLLAVQSAITQTVLRDNDRLERNITSRIDELKGDVGELKTKQDLQNGRVNRHEAQLAAIHARLDERTRGFFRALNKKQKAALGTAVLAIANSGTLLDWLRHLAMALFSLVVKGLAQP